MLGVWRKTRCHTVTGKEKRCKPKKQSCSFAVLWLPQNRPTHIKKKTDKTAMSRIESLNMKKDCLAHDLYLATFYFYPHRKARGERCESSDRADLRFWKHLKGCGYAHAAAYRQLESVAHAEQVLR